MPAVVSLPTKSSEITHLERFVDSLPPHSYLRSALGPFVHEFAHDVFSDIVPSVSESWERRRAADQEAVEAEKKVTALNAQIKALKAEVESQLQRLYKLQHGTVSLKNALDAAVAAADAAADRANRVL